jgi:uncharacterized coiled-coil protein SlyX
MRKRHRRPPRKRWLDVVEENLNRMVVQDWKELAQNREKLRDLVMAARTLKENQRPDEEEKGLVICSEN